jgi:hypothetical protein
MLRSPASRLDFFLFDQGRMEVWQRVADGFRDSIRTYGIRLEAESLGAHVPIVIGSNLHGCD